VLQLFTQHPTSNTFRHFLCSLSVLSPAHGPDHGSYQKAMGAELKPHFFDGGLAFMFETKYTVRLSKWSRCVVTSVFRLHVGLYMLIQHRSNYKDRITFLGLVLIAVFFYVCFLNIFLNTHERLHMNDSFRWRSDSEHLDRDYHKTWASLPRMFGT
jgi:hypothetical protein